MISAHRKTKYVWWPRLLAGAVVLFPYSISKIDFRSRIASGLSVSAHKASPAYAAFEDLSLNFESDFPEIKDQGLIRLAAGEKTDLERMRQLPVQRTLALKGLTIRALSEPETPAQVLAQAPKVTKFPAPEPARMMPMASNAPLIITDKNGELLPINERKKAIIEELGDEDWTIPTPAQLASDLAQQELYAMGVRQPDVNPAPNEEDEDQDKYVASVSTINPDFTRAAALLLKGQVEMTGGLAYVGPETHLTVRRVYNGQTLERGRIWISEGRFEIQIKKALGYLVAELQTRDGRVLGRGEMNLVHLLESPLKSSRVEDIRLSLRPTAEGAAFRTISGYSHGHQTMPVADARVEIEGHSLPQRVNDEGMMTEASIGRGSSFVARAIAPKHWASVVVGQANHPQDIRLFSNSLVDALIALQLKGVDRKEAYQSSIIWGQVMKDGKPIQGAEIEMAGSYQPIYFDEINQVYTPTTAIKKTGPNGLFAFLSVKAGVQALRVKYNGVTYPAQVFPTENKHVSYVELQVRDKIVSQFRVFDVFDFTKPVKASVRLVGTEELVPVSEEQLIEYAMAADPFMVEADAGPEYEISRTTLTGAPHLVQIPLINREWLNKLSSDSGHRLIAGRGIVAGFVDDQDFEIELTGYPPQESMQIVYFDSEGKPLNGRTGVAGGGFVIFNAPPGLQTVFIHPTQSRETFSQVVVAEPHYVHVLTWAQPARRKK